MRVFVLSAILVSWTAGTSVTVAASGVEEIPLRDTAAGKLFGTQRFAVRLDPLTLWAGEVLCDGRCVVEAADTRQVWDVKQGDTWITGSGTAIAGLGVERIGPDTIRSRMKSGDWSVNAYVQLFPDQRMLRRWFEITWDGAADHKIKGFWFQGGQLPLGEGGGYFYPAQYPPTRVATNELVTGRKTYNGNSPYPVVAERGDGWSAIWMTDESPDYSDRGNSGVTEGKGSLRVTQGFNMLGHVRPGVTQTVGDAWLWVQPCDAQTALCGMQQWFRFVHQVPPKDRPDWLKRVILYSFHPGGTIGSQFEDLGGFRPATDFLTHIHQLGCNAIWLMPLEDKSVYWPRDYYKLQEGLGTPEDYQALTAQARALGMRVWQDCVPHGGSNEYPRAKEHPEWLAQNEDGSTLHYWCFDFNWPTWIAYMSDVVTYYTRQYGLDGFRIDACGGSKIPNWNPDIPYARASHAQAQGGLAMQRALRQAVKAIRADGANLAEVGASIHGTVSDSTYDFRLCYEVLHDYRRVPAGLFVSRLRRWLHEQQCAEVPDLVRMRHLESHDSLRSGLWYGARPQRALLALISWIHGIPMVYHEMEDGHFDAYRTIFHVRRHVAELNDGAADYLSVTAPDGVFACLRTGSVPEENSSAWHRDYAWDTAPQAADRASVVLVNLGSRTVVGNVSLPLACLPTALRDATTARDLMSGKNLSVRHQTQSREIAVTLSPFGYTVLRFESSTLPSLIDTDQTRPVRASPLSARTTAPPLELKTRTGTLLIDPHSGLARAWRKDGHLLPGAMDLALPVEIAKLDAGAVCRPVHDGVEVDRQFGSRTLKMYYSIGAEEGVEVRAVWEGGVPPGAAIVCSLPDAAAWQAQTAEGLFASPFRVRHPQCDGVIGSIYRLPQGTAITWDSQLHPLGLSREQAWVGALSAQGRQTIFEFEPDRLPAAVQVLDRVGESHGMRISMAWQSGQDSVIWGGDELCFHWGATVPQDSRTDSTGDPRFRLIGGGWEFENGHVRVRVGRAGALTGLWRKQGRGWRQVLQHAGSYTDKGFDDGIRHAQENDVEASVRIQRHGSDIRLSIRGEMRGFERFDKMAHPVCFYSVYTFGDGPAFRYASAVQTRSAPAASYAFLSLLLKTHGVTSVAFADADGEFLTGERGSGNERFAQLANSPAPRRLPTDIRLSGVDGVTLRLGDMAWFGDKPNNVFMHGDDLHLAWIDGKADLHTVGQWTGMSCSVACQDTMAAGADPLPLARDEPVELLRSGQFDASDPYDLILLSTGQQLPRGRGGYGAWEMPPGARHVVEEENRCMMVEGDGQSYRLIRQAVPVQAFEPGSTWRLSARMKGLGVQRGDVGWKTACLRWSVAAEGQVTYAAASLPWGDSPWRTYEVLLTVPENMTSVTVEAGMNGNTGRVWIDDVRIEKYEESSR